MHHDLQLHTCVQLSLKCNQKKRFRTFTPCPLFIGKEVKHLLLKSALSAQYELWYDNWQDAFRQVALGSSFTCRCDIWVKYQKKKVGSSLAAESKNIFCLQYNSNATIEVWLLYCNTLQKCTRQTLMMMTSSKTVLLR